MCIRDRDTTVSTSTGVSSGSFSAPCSRDSAISSVTSVPSLVASCMIFALNLRTCSSSSTASRTASASSASAPTGVFSSWLTLATKSRRVASSRTDSDSSEASTTVKLSTSTLTRACTASGWRPLTSSGDRSTCTSSPSRRTSSAARRARSSARLLRTTPSSSARALCSTTSPKPLRTAMPSWEDWTTIAMRSATVSPGAVDTCFRAVARPMRKAAPPISTRPTTSAR